MAGDVIDSLSIELNSNATKANKAVDELISKLGNLANSLTRIDGSGLNGIANGVGKLGNSMQSMKGIGEAKFQNLANGINKLSAINTAGLNKSASALYQITKSFGEIGKIGENTKQIASLTTDLSKLGNKGISNAITNIPQLATAMKNLMTTLSTAPKVSNNLIKMTNAMANLASQGQKVSGATKGLTSTFKSYDSSATSSTSKTAKLSSMIGKMYQSFFYVKRGISGIKDAVKSSMDYIETLNYFDAAFGQVADTAVKDWKDAGYKSAEQYYNSFSERAKKLTSQMSGYNISSTGSLEATGKASLGIDPNQLMNYQATFAQMSSSIGMTGEQSVKLSRVLTEIGADLASVKNMDFKKTWNDMASGLAGMSRTLDKYGVNIRNVNLQQKLSDIGIQANIQNLNQNEKALLRTIILLNSTKYAYGDLAETINQPANQVRLLQANFQNLSRTIGNLFLPVVAKILPYINGLTIAMQRLFTYVGKKLGLDISSLTSSVGDSSFDMSELADNTDDVAGGLDDASKKAKKLKNNINTIGIDKLNIISKDKDKTDKDDNKGLNNSDLAKLNKAFEDAYEKYQKAWDKAFAGVDNKALQIADKITNAFKKGDYKGIGTYISNNLTKALKSINWDSIYEGAAKFGTGLAEFLNGLITPELFYEVGKTIAKFLGTRIQFALNFFQEFDWSNLGESLANGINGFFENYPFEDMANALNKFVDGLEKALFSFIKNVNWWHVFTGLWDFFTNLEIDTLLVIPMLRAFMKIRKNAGSTFKALQTIGSTSLSKLSKGFSALRTNVKTLGGKEGIAYTFMEARDSMSKTTKVMMGAGGILAAFAGVKNATKGMAKGSKSVVAGLGQIALSAGVAGAALTMVFGFPAGIIVAGVAAAIGAIVGLNKAAQETRQEMYGLTKQQKAENEELAKSYEKLQESQAEAKKESQKNDAEITYAQKLWKELQGITDENGKIKKGYEDRAKVLTKYINEQLGTELEVTGRIVKNYKETRNEIKKIIAMKRAETVLNANEELYSEAIQNENSAKNTLTLKSSEYSQAKNQVKRIQKRIEQMEKEGINTNNQADYFELGRQLEVAKTAKTEAKTALDDAKNIYKEYKNTIKNYEDLEEAHLSGNRKKIRESIDEFNNKTDKVGEKASQKIIDETANSIEGVDVSDIENAFVKRLEGIASNLNLSAFKRELKTAFGSAITEGIDGLDLEKQKELLAQRISDIELKVKVESDLGGMQLPAQAYQQMHDSVENKWRVQADVIKKKGKASGLASGLVRSADIFFANENGYSELIGRVGNNTAVANSDQIMTMVSNGVAKAVSDVLVPVLAGGGNGNTQRIEIPVIIDGKEITRIVNKNNSRNGAKIMGNETGYVYG